MTRILPSSLCLFASTGVLFLALLSSPGLVHGSPLDPSHPLWSHDPGSTRTFLDAQRDLTARRPPLWKGDRVGLARAAAFGARVLVVPVLYSNSGEAPQSREQIAARFFGPGEATVRGYWEFVSGGRLQLSGTVLPWIRLSRGDDFYRNVLDGRFVSSAGPRILAREALERAAEFVDDLSAFDDDGPDGIAGSGDDDGILDLVVLLHPNPGFEDNSEQLGPAMLAVQDRIDSDAVEIAAGVRADAFVLAGVQGPLGVWVHEFGHLLGLEDLYDLDVNEPAQSVVSRGGLGIWSLMAGGTWGDGGQRPSNLDPVSRRLLGWEQQVVLDAPGSGDLSSVAANGGQSLRLLPEGDWGRERFVFERRARREGGIVDGALPGDGVLVYRVDEALRENRSATGFWLELLEADGNADLRNLRNNGDPGDPFDGVSATGLGDDTNPSSASRLPDPTRPAPRIAISSSDAGGTQTVTAALVDGARLRLRSAFFDSGVQGVRAHLGLGESAAWRLRFEDIGASLPLSAQLQVQSLDARVVVDSGSDVALVRNGSTWSPSDNIVLRETGLSATSGQVTLRLSWQLDGDSATNVDLDLVVPVRVFGGLDAGAFDDFVSSVQSATADTTRFVPLTITELPLPTQSGWKLSTAGADTYANGAELTLTGPWFSPPADGRVSFWSTQETEESLPGQAFDAGVLEVHLPQRGWQLVELEGGPTVHVVQRSRASVRGAVGLGGVRSDWTAYTALLPRVDVPLQLRLRFGADASRAGGFWSVAGLRSGAEAARGTLNIEFDGDGFPQGRAQLQGDLSRLVTLRFRYRLPGSASWEVASQLFTVPDNVEAVLRRLTIPRSVDVATIGLFAEVAGGASGSTPELLLATAGYRAIQPFSFPRLLRNPTAGPVVLQLESQSQDLTMLAVDVRGRRVGRFTIPAGVTWFEWDGVNESGTRLASGVYFLVVEGQESLRRRLTILR